MFNKPNYIHQKSIALTKAMHQVLHRFSIDEDEWRNMKHEVGCLFVHRFSRLVKNPDAIKVYLLQSKPKKHEQFNFFWSWWNLKWMLNDECFIQSPAYYDDVGYCDVKLQMISDDLLESQLIQELQSFSIPQ